MQIHRQRGFTLIEIIFSIAMLSIVSAVLLNLFISAQQLNAQAQNTSHATRIAANAIELYQNDVADYTSYYDKNWQLCQQAEAVFYLTMKVTPSRQSDFAKQLDVAVFDIDDKRLIQLTTTWLVPLNEVNP